MDKKIDIGMNHWMQWFVPYNGPDERIGVIVWHTVHPDDERCIANFGDVCGGAVHFDVAQNAGLNRPKWQVRILDPLTLQPSLACHCGDHGFIVHGRWSLEPYSG